MKRYTQNFYLFGKKGTISSDSLMKKFDPNVLHSYIRNMTFENSIIFLGSRTFKHFNESYMYKIVNNFTKNSNFNHSKFLENKEKHYKIKYSDHKLNSDIMWHLLKRKISSNLTFPIFNHSKSHKEKQTICKGLTIKECKKKYESKTNVPQVIYNKNDVEIWHLVK